MFYLFLELLEKHYTKEVLMDVFSAVLRSQDIVENSWNGKSYELTRGEAASLACKEANLDEFWERIISVWNGEYWNDIQYFAIGFTEKTLKEQHKAIDNLEENNGNRA